MRKLLGLWVGVGVYVEGEGEREQKREEPASVLSKPLDCVPIGLLRAPLSSPNCSPHEQSVLAG